MIEIKGQMRPTDELKMAAHPDVVWVTGVDIKPIEYELKRRWPNIDTEYMPRR
jgi:hypothetical protein